MASTGVVRIFNAEEGVGVIDSQDTPDGCWVHFSAVAVEGFKTLVAGQAVEFQWEAVEQDGYDARALQVWPAGDPPFEEPPPSHDPSRAFGASLRKQMGTPTGSGDPSVHD